jgi:PAS domain S-box-containing protein
MVESPETKIEWFQPAPGDFVFVNRAAEGLFELPREEIVGKVNRDLFSGSELQYYLDEDERLLASGMPVEASIDAPGKNPVYNRRKVLIRNENGEAEYILGVTRDITGIIPALESCHALAHAARLAVTLPRDKALLVNLSGRGDKDMNTVAERAGMRFHCRPDCDPSRR